MGVKTYASFQEALRAVPNRIRCSVSMNVDSSSATVAKFQELRAKHGKRKEDGSAPAPFRGNRIIRNIPYSRFEEINHLLTEKAKIQKKILGTFKEAYSVKRSQEEALRGAAYAVSGVNLTAPGLITFKDWLEEKLFPVGFVPTSDRPVKHKHLGANPFQNVVTLGLHEDEAARQAAMLDFQAELDRGIDPVEYTRFQLTPYYDKYTRGDSTYYDFEG